MAAILIKRVYEPAGPRDGARFLVDRLWPRAIKKEQLRLAAWIKEVAPSRNLRRWFNHDPNKWEGFLHRYHAELDRAADAWKPLIAEARERTVTLLFAAHDPRYNNAVALKAYLDAKLKQAESPLEPIKERPRSARPSHRLRARPSKAGRSKAMKNRTNQ
jgi:uncharacterized protein YeaO (DUF488 family)